MREKGTFMVIFAIFVIGVSNLCMIAALAANQGMKSGRIERYVTATYLDGYDAEEGTPSNAVVYPVGSASDGEICYAGTMSDGLLRNECATFGELEEMLAGDPGGSILLTDDLVWESTSEIAIENSIEIDMDGHSIYIPEGRSFEIEGPVHFQGRGSERILFDAEGDFRPGNGVVITARGDGMTAVRSTGGGWDKELLRIEAYGNRAAAVKLTGSYEVGLSLLSVSAYGEQSVGIVSDGPVELAACSVEAEGIAVEAEQIKLAGSRAVPSPAGAEIIECQVVGSRLEQNGLCLEAGSSERDLEALKEENSVICYQLMPVDRGDEEGFLCCVPGQWDRGPGGLEKEGDYLIRLRPDCPADWFPQMLPEVKVPVHIVRKDRPFLMDAQDANEAAVIRLFTEIHGAEQMILYYSTDDGMSWHDSMELPDSFIYEDGFNVEPLQKNNVYLFRLYVKGGPMEGWSNVLSFPYYHWGSLNGGGDRDNGDRTDQGENPPSGVIIAPPPETDAGAGSTEDDSPGDGPEGNGQERDGPESYGQERDGPEGYGQEKHGQADEAAKPVYGSNVPVTEETGLPACSGPEEFQTWSGGHETQAVLSENGSAGIERKKIEVGNCGETDSVVLQKEQAHCRPEASGEDMTCETDIDLVVSQGTLPDLRAGIIGAVLIVGGAIIFGHRRKRQ